MRLSYVSYWLHFKTPSRTSRETMTRKLTCFLKVYDEQNPGVYGLGEASLFPGLSPEADETFEYKLLELASNIALGRSTDLSRHSSIQFGLEQALRDFSSGGHGMYFDSDFVNGKRTIDINGLVWMGNIEEMLHRAEEKIKSGFNCVKFKIGSLDWESEYSLLKQIRRRCPDIEIRVDANGAFDVGNVMSRLEALAGLNVSSIEQPVAPHQYPLMARICEDTPVPIAFDEELIGIYSDEERRAMLKYLRPQYIVLKPSLCGGFAGAEAWIAAATEYGIGWWITSALESNIGLSALAQWTALVTPPAAMAQGLGTGALYTDNAPDSLRLEGSLLKYKGIDPEQRDKFVSSLDWRG